MCVWVCVCVHVEIIYVALNDNNRTINTFEYNSRNDVIVWFNAYTNISRKHQRCQSKQIDDIIIKHHSHWMARRRHLMKFQLHLSETNVFGFLPSTQPFHHHFDLATYCKQYKTLTKQAVTSFCYQNLCTSWHELCIQVDTWPKIGMKKIYIFELRIFRGIVELLLVGMLAKCECVELPSRNVRCSI